MKRGQVALEFLTTYGWALMIILIMIGAISYFGVMNPSKLLPSKCQAGSELSCDDYQILEDGTMNLRLRQGVGKTIYVTEVNCYYEGDTVAGVFESAVPSDTPWSPRDSAEASCTLTSPFTGMTGQKVKISYDIQYKKSISGFTHLVEGELYTAVQ